MLGEMSGIYSGQTYQPSITRNQIRVWNVYNLILIIYFLYFLSVLKMMDKETKIIIFHTYNVTMSMCCGKV